MEWPALCLAAILLVDISAFGVWGAAGGSVLVGIGWFALGVQLIRTPR